MGHAHLTTGKGVSASGGRLGWRSCLRKGCGRRFQARRYNQRYCQDPECLREVRRWQGRNGNGSADPNLRDASGTLRRNASGENSGRRQPPSHRKTSLPPGTAPAENRARGHAADGIRRFFATVPAVMSRRGILLASRRRIVATTAVRPCIRLATANVSGCGARPKRADSSAAWNIRPHGPNVVKIVSLPAA